MCQSRYECFRSNWIRRVNNMESVRTFTLRTLPLRNLSIASLRILTIASLVAFLLAGPVALGPAQAHDPNKATLQGLSPAARSMGGPPLGVGPKRSMWGRFHAIFGDAPSGSNAGAIAGYMLVDD